MYVMKKYRIIASLLLLIMACLLLVGSTYAWFNNGKEVSSTGIHLRVQTVQKLEVSADAKKWRQTIGLREILDAAYEVPRLNQLPKKFQPVSTVGNLDNGLMEMFLGIVSTDMDPSSINYSKQVIRARQELEVDGETGKYLAFDLYFRNDSDKSLYLGRKSYVSYSGSVAGIENALRIAFVNEGSMETSDIKNIQSMFTTSNEDVVIWEPNYESHTSSGVQAAKDIYGLDITEKMDTHLEYYGIKAPIEEKVLLNSHDIKYFSKINNIIRTNSTYNKENGENIKICDLKKGISKIRIYAWIEGQDVDCENSAAGSTFVFNLHFTNNLTAHNKE